MVIGQGYRGGRCAVIGLVHTRSADGKGHSTWADIGRSGGRQVAQSIVTSIGARDRDTRYGNGLTRAHVLGVKCGSRIAVGHIITGDMVIGQGYRGGRCAVIGLVHTRSADGKGHSTWADIGRSGGRQVAQSIVTSIGARDRDTRYGNGLTRAHVLGVKCGSRIAVGHIITGDMVIGQGYRGGRCAVIGLVHTRSADGKGHSTWADIGRSGGRQVAQSIVTSIGARDRDTRYGNGLTRAHVLGVKCGSRIAVGHIITGDMVIGQGYRGGRCAVIGLVHTRSADGKGHSTWADIGRSGGRQVAQSIVTSIGARDRDTRYGNGLTRAHVLGVKRGRGIAVGHIITGDMVIGQGYRGGRCAVIGLVHTRSADGKGHSTWADIGRSGGRQVAQSIVTSIGARDRDTRYGNDLTRAHVLGVERGRGIAVGHIITGDMVIGQGYRGGR